MIAGKYCNKSMHYTTQHLLDFVMTCNEEQHLHSFLYLQLFILQSVCHPVSISSGATANSIRSNNHLLITNSRASCPGVRSFPLTDVSPSAIACSLSPTYKHIKVCSENRLSTLHCFKWTRTCCYPVTHFRASDQSESCVLEVRGTRMSYWRPVVTQGKVMIIPWLFDIITMVLNITP